MHGLRTKVGAAVDSAADGLTVEADPQLLSSAVMNVLHNGFKNTPKGGTVTLRAFASKNDLCLEVEDQCGGIPEEKGDLFKTFGDRRGRDRSGLGCIFSICVPLTATTLPAAV